MTDLSRTRLTGAQWEALAAVDHSPMARIRFPTGEALRKAGLVERETSYVVARDYANKDGVHPQWSGEPTPYHEWYLTTAGREALRAKGGDDGR